MTDPSPATVAIVKAFDDRYELIGGFDDNWQELCIAAALRALADPLVPDDPQEAMHFTNEAIRLNKQAIRHRILAIAAELENTHD